MEKCKLTEDHIKTYRRYLYTEERSSGTIQKYLRDIRAFTQWLGDRIITKECLHEWKEYLQEKRYAPVTVNSMLAPLNGLFCFLGWDYRIKFLKIQRKIFREENKELNRAEYDRLLETAKAQGKERLALLMETICVTVGACRRYPMSSYIKRKYKGRLDGCIVDELHEYNNDSGQGDAMAEIFSAADRVIGMTATLINGYSSGIFHLLYRVCPGLMLQDGKRHCDPADFDAEYDVVENIFEEEDGYAANGRTHRRKTRTRQLPGVSPLVYSRFLLEQTAFLSLSDMGKDLPDYEEIPIPLDMEKEVAEEYGRIESILRKILKTGGKAARRILSAYLNLLTAYPDQPYDQPPILDPDSGEPLVEPLDMGDFDTVGAKEQAVLDIVRRKVAQGERVLVYTSWTRTDSQQKLLKLLTGAGYRTEIMSEKIRPRAREEWVQKRLSAGLQVLITNPSLVETGLDLNAFTTLVFYSMGYKLFTLRQASRRSWRINQTAPRVEVYLLYYKDTMQHKAMKLMASKLAVAGIIEGNFTEEGLAAMSDVQDMTSQMAKELMLGIRDNVQDIASAFKKMAIINPGRSEPKAESAAEASETAADPPARDLPEVVFAEPAPMSAPSPESAELRRRIAPEKAAELAAILEKNKKHKRARKAVVDKEHEKKRF